MDNSILEKVGSILRSEAKNLNLELIKYRYYYSDEQKSDVLEVMIDHNFQITLEEIDKYTSVISPLLDDIDGLSDTYLLDVCSGGSEREIKEEDLSSLLDQYLEFKLKKDGSTLLAKLVSYNESEHSINVLYFLKGRKKEEVINLDDILEIHMGYKK